MKSYTNYPVESINNLREMYHKSAQKFGYKTLFRQKESGVYVDYDFKRYESDVDALGTELCARGLQGKRIIIAGENCYAWVVAYMAVICGVGVVVPVDKEIPAEEIANIAKISEASAVIFSEKYKEKIASIDSSVARISFDEIPELIRSGSEKIAAGDKRFLSAPIDENAMAALIFTSGTTGVSKGVMLSHHNICFNLQEMCRMYYIDDKDVFLAVLPLHHCYECTCGFLCQVYRGSTVAFSEGLRYITKNMQEVHPTLMLCVPLLAETMYRKIMTGIRKQGLEKKVKTAIKMTNAIPNAKVRAAAKKKIFADIHNNFGGNLRGLISGGAAVNPEVMKGLRDLGILTVQGYGLTECAPIAALNRDTFYNDGAAGLASPNSLLDIYDVQDDGTGEIRYKGENVMLGYYNMPELTKEVLHDGWFYTGDLGYLDKDGFLIITGRKKNVIVTSNGKNIFPEELETYLARNPLIAESVVVGYLNEKKKDYDIVALVYPNRDYAPEILGKDYTEEALQKALEFAISDVNRIVQSYKRIEYVLISPEEFPKNTSKKIKRAGIADSFKSAYLKKLK